MTSAKGRTTEARQPQTARETAMAVLREAEQVYATWSGRARDATAELERVESSAGEVALANIDAVAVLPKRLQGLRDEIFTAERAAAVAESKVAAARVVVLLAEAVEWDEETARRQGALDSHEARTRELLVPLEEHEGGRFVSVNEANARSPLDPMAPVLGGAVPFPDARPLRSDRLRAEVWQSRIKAAILREFASGRSPRAVTQMGALTDILGWGNRALSSEEYPDGVYELGLRSRPVHDQAEATVRANLDATRRILDETEARVDQLTAEAAAALDVGGPGAGLYDREPLRQAEKDLSIAKRNHGNAARAAAGAGVEPAQVA